MVIESRKGEGGRADLDLLLADAGIEIIAVTKEQVQAAREAFRRFGKGRHAAKLNFGDCFSYALAKTTGEPPLFKGQEFSQTDLECLTA